MAIAQIDYESLPYNSMPFPQSQPSHLAALASMHACSAPSAETARVLELGCASGGNLIPLAARFPNAVFVGVDLSERHAREGKSLVRDLGLKNITIRQGDIAALDVSGAKYDYIICHGVFSWVPRAVQDAIFRICAESLTDNGIAYVSYNVLPGWHFRLIIRDICRLHAGVDETPQQQIARARATLDQVASLSDEMTTFGKVLREEVQRSQQMNDSHFIGEFLGSHNEPCHFHEFIARANANGLSYLCDAGLSGSLPDPEGPERNEAVHKIGGGGIHAIEQGLDILTGRTFRRSLLVKGSGSDERVLRPGGLADLHFACPLRPEESKDGAFVLRQDKAQLTTNDPVVGVALIYLATVYPETRSLAEIVMHVVGKTGQRPAAFSSRLSDALLRTVKAGHVTSSGEPLRVGRADDDRPALWSVARAQVRQGHPWVSNLLHAPIQISPAVRFVAGLLDGINTRAQIESRLATAIQNGELVVDGIGVNAGPAVQRELAGKLLGSILQDFRRSALLSPQP